MMQITICHRSLLAGLLLGCLASGAIWAGTTLAGRAEITQVLLTVARCDNGGLVTLLFADGSQYTCVPPPQVPPTSRDEARARQRGGR